MRWRSSRKCSERPHSSTSDSRESSSAGSAGVVSLRGASLDLSVLPVLLVSPVPLALAVFLVLRSLGSGSVASGWDAVVSAPLPAPFRGRLACSAAGCPFSAARSSRSAADGTATSLRGSRVVRALRLDDEDDWRGGIGRPRYAR